MSLENIAEICIAIDTAILGIAYPIIIDKISNIGDKYSSDYLSNVFNSEFPQNEIKLGSKKVSTFQFMLYFTILILISVSISTIQSNKNESSTNFFMQIIIYP